MIVFLLKFERSNEVSVDKPQSVPGITGNSRSNEFQIHYTVLQVSKINNPLS